MTPQANNSVESLRTAPGILAARSTLHKNKYRK